MGNDNFESKRPTAANAQSGTHVAAIDLCKLLAEQEIPHALLGEARRVDCSSSRVTVVVAPTALARIPILLHQLSVRCGVRLVQCVRRDLESWCCTLAAWQGTGAPTFLTVEVFSDVVRNGLRIFSAESLLGDRSLLAGTSEFASCYVTAPGREFIYCLTDAILHGELSDGCARHLSQLWQEDPVGAEAQLRRFWDVEREGGIVVRAAHAKQWQPVRDVMPTLESKLRRGCGWQPVNWLRERARRAHEWLRPTGLLVACLGPDGSGIRDVIEQLAASPMRPFSRVLQMELRPRIIRGLSPPQPAVRVRRQKPRGRLGATLKLLMFAVDYWLGYWLMLRPRMVRSSLVLSNRYYDDVFADPGRYRLGRPRAFARALLPWIPRPHLWLIFDAPSEVLRKRNQHVSTDESTRQRREYRRVLRGFEHVVVLDARDSIEAVGVHAQQAVLTHLARRTAVRLKLPVQDASNSASTRLLLFFCRRHIPLLSRLVRIIYNSDIYCRLPQDVQMPHPYGVVISAQSVIGNRVTIMQQVTIGDVEQGESVAPVIGDDVYIGAGARVMGDVRIGDGATIGANAVVTRDIPPGATVVGANRILPTPVRLAGEGQSQSRITPFPASLQRH
jgi:serine O-acetyltransferase